MTQTPPPTKTIDLALLPNAQEYIQALANDIDEIQDLTESQIITKFLMELKQVDEHSPLLYSKIPFEQLFVVIEQVADQLMAYHIDPHDDDYVGCADEAKRLAIATELFLVMVEAMFPKAIVQNDYEEKDVPPKRTRVFSYTVRGNLTVSAYGNEDLHQIADDALECMRPTEKEIPDYSVYSVDLEPEDEDDEDEEEDNTELAIQVSHEHQVALEIALHSNFGLTVEDLMKETDTENVLIYFIGEEETGEYRLSLLAYLQEKEQLGVLKIRQDRGLCYEQEQKTNPYVNDRL